MFRPKGAKINLDTNGVLYIVYDSNEIGKPNDPSKNIQTGQNL